MANVTRRGRYVDIVNIKLENFKSAPDSKSGKTKILYNQAVAGDELIVDGIKFSVLGYVKKDASLPAEFEDVKTEEVKAGK